jgi:hypothetical protein
MAHPPAYTFSKADPDNYRSDLAFGQARQFAVDRRNAALLPVTGHISGSHVQTVTDEPLSNWDQVFDSAATSLLSGVPGVPDITLRSAYVRSAMRGQGRDRWRR